MRRALTLLAALADTSIATPALAQDDPDQWYLSVSGSVSLLNDSHTYVVGKPVPPGYAQTVNVLNAGPGIQIAVGHRIGDGRVEIEGGYSRNNSDHYIAITPANGRIAAEGGHKAWRVMANGYYDFGQGPFRPYVGGGIGYINIKARNFAARPPFPTEKPLLIIDDRKGEFAYQAMAGASYAITSSVSLTAQYRWLSAGKVHLHDLAGTVHIREHRGHNIDLGIRIAL